MDRANQDAQKNQRRFKCKQQHNHRHKSKDRSTRSASALSKPQSGSTTTKPASATTSRSNASTRTARTGVQQNPLGATTCCCCRRWQMKRTPGSSPSHKTRRKRSHGPADKHRCSPPTARSRLSRFVPRNNLGFFMPNRAAAIPGSVASATSRNARCPKHAVSRGP